MSLVPNLQYYIADIKTSFVESPLFSQVTDLTSNYSVVLNGLKANAVNVVRLPIIPIYKTPSEYSTIYKAVASYAVSIGLKVYGSPLGTGFSAYSGWTNAQYAQWLADWAVGFNPDFLSPFNESGLNVNKMKSIVGFLRPLLPTTVAVVGPDNQHVETTVTQCAIHPELPGIFDILSSHNANQDTTSTINNWSALAAIGKPLWASECPEGWDDTKYPGVNQMINSSGIMVPNGLVIWQGYPNLVDAKGINTTKGFNLVPYGGIIRP